ncbi:hypothetical protein EA187_17435 [Lujinxingia sediminis]|uniref:Uncharacterized protein n=1 Tax=Lujinxingia sediminis TaxID=2480984 RepID=A0ABY0CNU7_9DELT|nr:hypothetical protein [Lujinxingia sediminis]RVU42121.1 hypothetical protein EA187_17435 [Lujinxingia sediminis]
MLLRWEESASRMQEIEDPDVVFLIKVVLTILSTHESGFYNRPEPIDVVALIDALEVLFSKKGVFEAYVDGRLDELRWWSDDD